MEKKFRELEHNITLKPREHVRYNHISATIMLPHNRYVDKVLSSDSRIPLLERFVQCNSPTKEISESYAAFSRMKKYCDVSKYTWLHIGDGAYTRTAAVFAFFSKSVNISIDPIINDQSFRQWRDKYDVQHIDILKSKFQDVDLECEGIPIYDCITCVHAHVNLEEVDKIFPKWKYLYSNPCCTPHQQTFSSSYMKENNIVCLYDDINLGILSERRRVVIYKNLKNVS